MRRVILRKSRQRKICTFQRRAKKLLYLHRDETHRKPHTRTHASVAELTCFFCSRKYSEWYMVLFSASSTHSHQGSDEEPWILSSHSNSGVIHRRTRRTVRVIGCMVAASDRDGKLARTFFTTVPIRGW